jgi:hypothetical protein
MGDEDFIGVKCIPIMFVEEEFGWIDFFCVVISWKLWEKDIFLLEQKIMLFQAWRWHYIYIYIPLFILAKQMYLIVFDI